MGLIDPMLISNAAAMGVIPFSTGPVLAAVTGALLGSAIVGILTSRRSQRRPRRQVSLPSPPLRVAPAGVAAK